MFTYMINVIVMIAACKVNPHRCKRIWKLLTSSTDTLERPEHDQLDHCPRERTCEGEDQKHGKSEEHDDFSSKDI